MKKQEQQKNGCRERSLTSISRRVSSGAMLVALAMIFSYVESLIPINLGVPGIKLGVANLVTVTGLYILAPMEVLLVVILRVLAGGIYVRKRHVDPVQSGRGYFKFSGDAAIEADQRIFHDRHKHCRRRVP
ncbi:MAG: Gx transporter family protein [Lachnospiraceae bacterium]